MRKTILTLLGSVLLVASVAQAASATQLHRDRRVASNPAPLTQQQFRDSSASVWTPVEPSWSGWSPSGYYSHGYSAPAGR
jgi:hypothetical protein